MKILALMLTLGFVFNANAALQPNAEAMQALLEVSSEVSVGDTDSNEGSSLAWYLSKKMIKQSEASIMTTFKNFCQDKVEDNGNIKCELYISSSKMMMAPGPEGKTLTRVQYESLILSYQVQERAGTYTVVSKNISVLSR